MPNTPLHALPYPLGSDAPNAPAQLQSLATVADTALPIVQSATPTNVMGRVWRNPTSGVTQIGDGSAWAPIGNGPPSRIRWARTANIASGAYTDTGTMPANAFVTQANLTSPNNLSRFTISQACLLFIDFSCGVGVSGPSGNAYLHMSYPAGTNLTRSSNHQIVSVGGNQWEGTLTYSGLFVAGDTFDLYFRTWTTSSLWTFNTTFTAMAVPAYDLVGTQT